LKWGAPFPNSIARFARGWKPSAGDSAICIFAGAATLSSRPPKLAAISEFRIILLHSSGKGQPENFQNAPNPGIPLRHVAMSHGDQNMVNDRLRRLRTGAIDETRKLFWIFIYLWVLLSLFSFHKALVLNEEYLIYDQVFALINALALAKVILLGEYFHVGERFKDRPLIYPILFKSALFAVLLIFFHIIEETLIGLFHGKTFFQSIPSIGGGKLQGILMVGVIMFVVLMPFFAFTELDRAIGTEELRFLLFGDKTEAGATPRTSWRTAAAAAFAALVIGGGWLIWALNRGTAHYVTQKPEPGSVVGTVTASVVGTAATTPVGARVSGVIQALECGANMKVKAGQFCAKIDPRPFQIMVDQNKSDLADAETRFERDKAALTEAKAAFEHREALAKRRAISQKAIDKSRNAFEQAQARTKHDEATVAQLQAALHAAETDLGHTEIVAPVDGTVVSRNVEIGQTVAAGSEAPPLFLIATDPSTPN
jgi:biotin carboxyl carrier protein